MTFEEWWAFCAKTHPEWEEQMAKYKALIREAHPMIIKIGRASALEEAAKKIRQRAVHTNGERELLEELSAAIREIKP